MLRNSVVIPELWAANQTLQRTRESLLLLAGAGAGAAELVVGLGKCVMGKKETIDPDSVINDFFKYVGQYRNASNCLSNAENTLFPNQQVRGLLIELALKTYICASGKVSWGHDLKALTEEAMKHGLKLDKNDHTNVISNTNDIYFRGGHWDSDYICRYPKPNRSTMVTVTPTHEMVDEMVERIISQAKKVLVARKKA